MKTITKKTMWIFAIGQLGWSLLSGIVTNWLVYFYQPNIESINAGQTVYIPQGKIILGILTVTGIIAALGRVFDAITDPLIASKSDSCTHKDGRRIPFMRAIAIPFGIITVLIFCAPVNSTSFINVIWLLITSLLYYLFLTIYCTPYNALIPELGKTQEDRINISTFISITFFLGTSIAYLASNIWSIFEPSIGRISAIRLTLAILAAIATVCMLVPVFFIKEKDYVIHSLHS